MKPASQTYAGVLFLMLAALCWSTAGLFTRLIALDPWTILSWMTLGTLAFIPALALTSVASVAIIYATTPLIVAGLSRIWLGERVRAVTVLAGLIATGGVAVMGSDRGADISSAGLVLA